MCTQYTGNVFSLVKEVIVTPYNSENALNHYYYRSIFNIIIIIRTIEELLIILINYDEY